tara:strand:+ start:11 stop:1213 length:1203 start_codon:yes stop_codon:yes gene_type:complete
MGGGLLQLVAYGAQDVYLTGNPQITFFKVVYRRHTNFALEAIQQTFNGNPGYGNTVTCQISRNGDLINRVYLQLDVPAVTGSGTDEYVHYLGLRLLKSVIIEIGGQQIDKHHSDWMYIWNELSLPIGKRYAYDKMVGKYGDVLAAATTDTTLYIPLEFWFCRNVGLALPLIALQYHEVKIKIEFEQKNKCIVGANRSITLSDASKVIDIKNVSLWVDYIFLDTDERRRFAQLSHEYLIEQLQFTGTENLVSGSNRTKLNFNHPCKELIWVSKITPENTREWYNYATTAGDEKIGNPFKDAILQLNGNDRFAIRNGDYFNLVQPYQHHTNIPSNAGINVYSFALKPEDHQPSGTLNMSRIDTATLMVNVDSTLTYTGQNIYAVNYNVLRILSGMGGLAYSN